MIKHFGTALGLSFMFAFAIVTPLSAAETRPKTGDNVHVPAPLPQKSNRTVLTDMNVPPECLDYGRTVCAQLPANATRQLVYGVHCYKLQNKTANMLFVPLRTDNEIEQFLLNVPASQVHREPCQNEKKD